LALAVSSNWIATISATRSLEKTGSQLTQVVVMKARLGPLRSLILLDGINYGLVAMSFVCAAYVLMRRAF
jgi:hypothetical protein